MKTCSRHSRRVLLSKVSSSTRLEQMHAFADLCFVCLEENDPKELANLTGLSVTTLWRLRTHQSTLATHFRTMQSLGAAAGLSLDIATLRVTVR